MFAHNYLKNYMRVKYYILFGILSFLALTSCKSTNKNEITFFGGQIKNPKDNMVYLYQGNKKITESPINQNSKFSFKLDSIQAGLYTFKHGEEYQYIYIEPKDSLQIRLNTWDFDESLVFSGKGAERNNFLIQLFLDNERDAKLTVNFFKLNERDFLKNSDSLIKLKKLQFKQFKSGTNKQSKKFEELIQTAIYFPIYANKERYASYAKYLNNTSKLPELSIDFYTYRKKIKLKNNLFPNYYTFQNYLWNHVYNLALYEQEKDTLQQLSTLVLKQIVKTVSNQSLKNTMLQKTYINSLLDSDCVLKDNGLSHQIFIEHCTDNESISKVDKLIKTMRTFKKGTIFPSLNLINTAGTTITTSNFNSKNTVIYFWPKELNRIQNMAKRIHYLTKKHPYINFIGIDTQLDNYNWKAYIKANQLDYKNQFQLQLAANSSYFTNDIPRAIILNNKKIIQSNFTHLSHHNFEKKLLQLKK